MSSGTKAVITQALFMVPVILIVGGIALSLLCVIVGWIFPLATAGAVAPDFSQSLAIVTMALMARVILFAQR